MMLAEGICTANVAKWRCMRGVIVKLPAVGFMHAQYWMFDTSFSTTLAYVAAHRVSG